MPLMASHTEGDVCPQLKGGHIMSDMLGILYLNQSRMRLVFFIFLIFGVKMVDITMCSNSVCPNFKKCYRAQAKPSKYQSYCEFKYVEHQDGVVCDFYRPILAFCENKEETNISSFQYETD